MNIAVIFAGGVGSRMHSKERPKQFLEMYNKPIIIHTLEHFEKHKDIDAIVVVCINGWIQYLKDLLYKFRIEKVKMVVPGGTTGQLSIYNGLKKAAELYGTENTIVLIHDGVRPLIDEDIITANIETVKKFGNAITCSPTKESVVLIEEDNSIQMVVERDKSRTAKAPESFYLKDILSASEKSISKGIVNEIDSCTLMSHYGVKMHIVEGNYDNIKITTPEDFYMFRAIYDARENDQLL